MHDVEVVVGLVAAVAVLAGVAARLDVPYPVVLVLGGLGLGLVPGLPSPRLDPDLVFFVFLPPLLYRAGFFSSVRDLRDHAGQIGLLAVGLVLATLLAAAAVAHWAVGIPWAPSFVLGAVLGPTDPVAASAVIRRVGAPQRIVTILEGEALVNDGTALSAYRVALAAVAAGAFSLGGAVLDFAGAAAGGVAMGLAVGWAASRVRRLLEQGQIEITISLLTPYVAYIPAERLGVSGVLAAVAAGLWAGWASPAVSSPGTRLQSQAFWDVLSFLLDSLLFLLVGLQLTNLVGGLAGQPPGRVVLAAVALPATLIAVRMAWMFTVARGLHVLDPRVPDPRAHAPARELVVLGWSGMRGAISLAAALAIPLEAGGRPFPDRDLLVFLTYTSLMVTLVLPAVTLPALLGRLGLGVARQRRREETDARLRLTHAALGRLEEMAAEGEASDDVVAHLRGIYEARQDRLEAMREGDERARDGSETQRARRALIAAEREALSEMRRRREVSSEAARAIRRDLDLTETRLGGG